MGKTSYEQKMSDKKRRWVAVLIMVTVLFVIIQTITAGYVTAESATGTKVTYKGAISSMGTTCGKFKIKGRDAFCAEHPKVTPATGTKITSTKLVTNNKMRKALYYGYGGPEARVSKNNAGWVSTSVALSRANGKGGGTAAARKFYNSLGKYAVPPASFKVYLCNTAGGKQDLCYWIYTPEGKLRVKKESSEPNILEDRSYSLEGAVYGVYKNIECDESSLVAKLITKESGVSEDISLEKGDYFIKESIAPKGFQLSETVYPVNITDQSDITVAVVNVPEEKPAWVMLQKVDAETGEPIPSGNGELKGAEFTVKYYKGTDWDDDPEKTGEENHGEWVFRTKENGTVCFDDEDCFVSGDERYYNNSGKPSLPVGTITIRETKASKGYSINDEVFIVKILADDNVPGVSLSQIPTIEVRQQPIRGDLEIIKTDSKTGSPIGGVAFDVIDVSTSMVIDTIVTDEKGYATTASGENLDGSLPYGEYIVSETETPAGYMPIEDIKITVKNNREKILLNIKNTPAEIGTRAFFKENHAKEILPIKNVTIVDEVKYKNLIPGTEYRLKGVLMETETGEPLLINGEEVRTEILFVPESPNGTVNMEFMFDASSLMGKSVTVFETLYINDTIVASHEDITDSEQTVRFSFDDQNDEFADTGDDMSRVIPLTIALLIISFMGALVSVSRKGKSS